MESVGSPELAFGFRWVAPAGLKMDTITDTIVMMMTPRKDRTIEFLKSKDLKI